MDMGASGRALMSVRVGDTKVSLTYGEVAIAVHASDMPGTRRAAFGRDLAELVIQGVARLGMQEIRWRDTVSCAAVLALAAAQDAGVSAPPGACAAYDRLWPSRRRAQLAHDVAFHVLFANHVIAGTSALAA
jgi:hypothetical protein